MKPAAIKKGSFPVAENVVEVVNDNARVQNERQTGIPFPTAYDLRELLHIAPH
jgi:hypothetical protein